ncbi:MAG: carboxypeptidase regulatory-like domain-containing protein [Pseudomonadota bacterium]
MMPLLLTDALPLRRATDLPNYRADTAERCLPWVFGRATLTPVPIDLTGQEWIIADHPVTEVVRVTVAGKVTTGWQLQQRLDATGHAIAVLRLAQPTITDPVTVTVAGRRHPTTGALLSTPGDMVRELMRLCGHVEPVGSWSGLDEHYGQTELGLVFESPQPLREALASIIEPLHAVWRPGWAAPRSPDAPVAVLDVLNTHTISARTDNTTLATVARVAYAQDWAAGAERGALRLVAPDALARWGELVLDVELPAVRRARDALAFATARLADSARATWTVTADVDARIGTLRAGQTVALAHPHVPAGLALLTAVVHDREQAVLHITATLYVESVPTVEMQRRNTAVDPAAAAEPVVRYRDGVATFTVFDDQGNEMANATVTLDGMHTANTDGAGRVQFKTPRGAHTLQVSMPGFADFEIDVIV